MQALSTSQHWHGAWMCQSSTLRYSWKLPWSLCEQEGPEATDTEQVPSQILADTLDAVTEAHHLLVRRPPGTAAYALAVPGLKVWGYAIHVLQITHDDSLQGGQRLTLLTSTPLPSSFSRSCI